MKPEEHYKPRVCFFASQCPDLQDLAEKARQGKLSARDLSIKQGHELLCDNSLLQDHCSMREELTFKYILDPQQLTRRAQA